MVTRVKRKFGYDDALDAFGVHGAGGTLGALLTSVFATSAINEGLKDAAGMAWISASTTRKDMFSRTNWSRGCRQTVVELL